MKGSVLRTGAVLFLAVQACVGVEVEGDPRLGEEGHVRFTGGGCGNSTTLAVGSTQKMTLEPQEGVVLPADLAAGSTAPSVIDARRGATVEEVVLTAHAAGEAYVELRAAGDLFDRVRFRAEPAASVKFEASAAVFSGGTWAVKVEEVYGACGEDCPLLGEDFVVWSAAPEATVSLVGDANRVAVFTAGAPGDGRVLGREPSGGGVLVDHPLRVLPTTDAGELGARITVALPDETVVDPRPLPVELPVGSLFLVELFAAAAGTEVPIAGADVTWSVEGETTAVEVYPAEPADPPEGPVFAAVGPGAVTLVADVPLLGRTGRFDLTITADL